MSVDIKIGLGDVHNIPKTLEDLKNIQILVGFPSDDEQPHLGSGVIGKNKRDPDPHRKKPKASGNEITNAQLAYIHNYGATEAHIPARPFMEPGINAVRDQTTNYFEQMGQAAFEGKASTMDQIAHAIGLLNQSSIKNIIAAKIPPPLAPATKAARLRKSKLSAAEKSRIMTEGDFTPLIDTHQMWDAVSYVIRRKKGSK